MDSKIKETKTPELHSFCKRQIEKQNSKCIEFHREVSKLQMCPYGFTCYNDGKCLYYGYKVKNHYNEKKIRGHEKNSDFLENNMSIFDENDFFAYL